MLDPELERELRAAINPIYEDVRGTESYERKRLLGEIDHLREYVAHLAVPVGYKLVPVRQCGAAPEIKVDMEPVAWILPTDPVRIVDHMNFNANYGGTVKELYSAEQVAALQAQLAERDKTILEQQARIEELIKSLTDYNDEFTFIDDLSALEAALKAERIKTLREAISVCNKQSTLYCDEGGDAGTCATLLEELCLVENKLKEQP